MPRTVTIVGLGPRGLGLLERLVTLVDRDETRHPALEVQVIDPSCTGAGVHSVDQPDYLLMHCPGTDLTMFPDSASLESEPDHPGATFFEWARDHGVRVLDRPGDPSDRAVQPTDFLPRRIFGEYLQWFLDDLVARSSGRVRISFRRDVAVDAREEPDGRLVVTCRSGVEVFSDFLCITVGYGQADDPLPNGQSRLTPFPLPREIANVPSGALVAVSGFGLTALDIVSCLTVGRGGRFQSSGTQLEYVPAGREPQIVMFSRSGVPARARPHRVGVRQDHEPAILTDELVRRLRARGPGTLDFESELLPLIETEMRVAYWRTYGQAVHRAAVDGAVAADTQRLTGLLDALELKHGQPDMHALFTGTDGIGLDDPEAYERWVYDYIAADLEEAARYPEDSPGKAALEVVEDTFDTLRAIVAHGALTHRSQTSFLEVHGPRLRRIAVGPIAERQAELAALMRAGVVRAPLGPDPVVEVGADDVVLRSHRLASPNTIRASALLLGHLPALQLDGSGPELITNLHARGLLRPYRLLGPATGTVDVDDRLHPRDVNGLSHPRIWLLGPICEGVSFYTHVLPEPGNHSDCVVDAHRVVSELLDLASDSSAAPSPPRLATEKYA